MTFDGENTVWILAQPRMEKGFVIIIGGVVVGGGFVLTLSTMDGNETSLKRTMLRGMYHNEQINKGEIRLSRFIVYVGINNVNVIEIGPLHFEY